MPHPIPENEQERLRVLRDLQILDTAQDPRFDQICERARREFGVPTVLISFVDEHRQWFKARCGMEAPQTPREIAFCSHAILNDGVLVIPDARKDPRFAENPLVVGPPHIRFYAGAPLLFGQNIRLGTLCLMDDQPRRFDAEDITRLEWFAESVSGELWAHDAKVHPERYEVP